MYCFSVPRLALSIRVEGAGFGPSRLFQLSQVSQRGSLNVVEFLPSDEGARAFKFWSSGTLPSQRVLFPYGKAVLEAFETNHVARDSL